MICRFVFMTWRLHLSCATRSGESWSSGSKKSRFEIKACFDWPRRRPNQEIFVLKKLEKEWHAKLVEFIEWIRPLLPRSHGTLSHLKLQESCSWKTSKFPSIFWKTCWYLTSIPNHPGARRSFITLSLWLCSWWCCRRLGSIVMHQCITAWRSNVRLYFSSPGTRMGSSLGWRSVLGTGSSMWESWVKIERNQRLVAKTGSDFEEKDRIVSLTHPRFERKNLGRKPLFNQSHV